MIQLRVDPLPSESYIPVLFTPPPIATENAGNARRSTQKAFWRSSTESLLLSGKIRDLWERYPFWLEFIKWTELQDKSRFTMAFQVHAWFRPAKPSSPVFIAYSCGRPRLTMLSRPHLCIVSASLLLMSLKPPCSLICRGTPTVRVTLSCILPDKVQCFPYTSPEQCRSPSS